MSGSYSVDEASSLLGIPRPTLYRYLREYSIPNIRKSGRISIPEDSVEKIRRVRDLHREGMGTGSVRRLISEPQPPNTDEVEIASRLDRITQELEGVKVEGRLPETLSSEQAIRTILARQTMLISAVINLTEMVEDMVRLNGHPPRRRSKDNEAGIRRYAVRDTPREVALTGGHRSSSRVRESKSGRGLGGTVRSGGMARSSVIGGSPTVRVAAQRRRAMAEPRLSSGAGRAGHRGGGRNRARQGSNYGSLARRRRRAVGALLLIALVATVSVLGVVFSSLV